MPIALTIESSNTNFEREKLKFPFGFKGGYLSELWQVLVRLNSTMGHSAVGLATQSVLYGDADFFVQHSEAAGNAIMFALTERATELLRGQSFQDPITCLEYLVPALRLEAQRLTGRPNINESFILNALVAIDHAMWLLYSKENQWTGFDAMLPEEYRSALSHRNSRIGIMFQVSYQMPMEDIIAAVDQGYFIIKIKTGQPGSTAEMLQKDMDRLTEIHLALKDKKVPSSPEGRAIYTIDANGRYPDKATLQQFIDHADKIGALDRILFIEEPLQADNTEEVFDLPVRIGADDSVHSVSDAKQRIERGYQVLVLKGIAKTLSISLKIAKLAYEHNIPCVCSDLTVNPLLVDWHKNLAARLKPFPKLNMGVMETNGDMNYIRWETLRNYHPKGRADWTNVVAGAFHLDQNFYHESGGIFDTSEYYRQKV